MIAPQSASMATFWSAAAAAAAFVCSSAASGIRKRRLRPPHSKLVLAMWLSRGSRHRLPHPPPEPACDRAGGGARLARTLHLEHANGAVARGDDDVVIDRQNRARIAAGVDYANVGELDRLASALHEDARPGIERAEAVVDRL